MTTDTYRKHFKDRWVPDSLNILAGSSSVANILDRHAHQFGPDDCFRTEFVFSGAEGAFVVGVSGGWIGGAIGASGSVLDENCSIMESSRRLFDLGQKEASIQIMCLIDTARQALEATGTKCLIKAQAQAETVKP